MSRLPRLPKDTVVDEQIEKASQVNLTTKRIVRIFDAKGRRLTWFEEFITQTACSPTVVRKLAAKSGILILLLTREGDTPLTSHEFVLLMGCAEE